MRIPRSSVSIQEPPKTTSSIPSYSSISRDSSCRLPGREAAGVQLRQRLTVTAGERDGDGARPFHVDLVRALRRARAEGATALRGAWGHTGDEARHAERLLALRRSGPVLVTLVERPAAMARLWPVVERATERHGLVTCELVPTARIVGS